MNPVCTCMIIVAFAAVSTAANDQPRSAILAADPSNGRIVEFVENGQGVRVQSFLEGPPLVEPTAIIHETTFPHTYVYVADRVLNAVAAFDRRTREFRGYVVEPGMGGLVDPVDLALLWRGNDRDLLVLSGVDGTVRRYDLEIRTYLGIVVQGLGRADSLTTSGNHQTGQRFGTIAYPDAGEVLRFDIATGAIVDGTTGLRRPVGLRRYNNGTYVVESDNTLHPSRVVRLFETGGIADVVYTLPIGTEGSGFVRSDHWGNYIAATDGVYINLGQFGASSQFYYAPAHANLRSLVGDSDGCYADFDPFTSVPLLDIFDYLAFANSYARGDPLACNCDTSTGMNICDVFDFLCFSNHYAFGCP